MGWTAQEAVRGVPAFGDERFVTHALAHPRSPCAQPNGLPANSSPSLICVVDIVHLDVLCPAPCHWGRPQSRR
jgi:hypothetical protein